MKTVCLDAGHGDHDSGCVGPSGTKEKDVALDICHRIRERIERSVKVVMTRRDDSFLTLANRCNIANNAGADLFLSVHLNAANGRAHGFEAFTSRGKTKSDDAATIMLNDWALRFPGRTPRFGMGDGDPDKEASFAVLTGTSMPAVLFECCFLDHAPSEVWVNKEDTRDAMAEVLAGAVLKFLDVTGNTTTLDRMKESSARVELLAARDAINNALSLLA